MGLSATLIKWSISSLKTEKSTKINHQPEAILLNLRTFIILYRSPLPHEIVLDEIRVLVQPRFHACVFLVIPPVVRQCRRVRISGRREGPGADHVGGPPLLRGHTGRLVDVAQPQSCCLRKTRLRLIKVKKKISQNEKLQYQGLIFVLKNNLQGVNQYFSFFL